MSIKQNSALEINEEVQIIIERKESAVEAIRQDSYIQNDDDSFFAENDECSFVKGYN